MKRLLVVLLALTAWCPLRFPLVFAAAEEPKAVATTLRFLWTVDGVTVRRAQFNGTVLLPMGTEGRLEVRGFDAEGHPVPLSAQVWSGSGEWFVVSPTADPNVVTVTPLSPGPYDPALFNGDGDPGPGVSPIWGFLQVRVVERS